MQKLRDCFYIDYHCHVLWVPVFFAAGIIYYFLLTFEPSLVTVTIILLLNVIIYMITRKRFPVTILLLNLSAGLFVATVRTATLHDITITGELKYAKLEAEIESITPLEAGNRLLLINNHIDGLTLGETPLKIRLATKSDAQHLRAGQRIRLKANLAPPPKAVIPGGYDFARNSWFKQIGAVGYNVSKLYPQDSPLKSSWWQWIENFRQNLKQRIISVLGSRSGYIATAMMIGEYSAIPKDILKDMRIAGLTHILSVSGMHLSMVAAICFFYLRLALNLFDCIALRYNVKKLAATFAFLGSLSYLLISGRQIAAERAFIMTSLLILAILLDRVSTPMRTVLFTAAFLLCLWPEQITNPSFQMSFAAVIALFASFGMYHASGSFTIFKRITSYFLATLLSSLIAGLATAPYAAYHFHQYSNYSVLANLLAVPLTSIIIMPAVVIAFLLIPFHLEYIALIPMGYAIDLIVLIAAWVASFPHAVKLLPPMPDLSLGLITLGGLWLCIWQSWWRYLGLLPIIFALGFMYLQVLPDLMIDGKSGNYAFRDNSGHLLFSPGKWSGFTKGAYLSYMGQELEGELNCPDRLCVLSKGGRVVHINQDERFHASDCKGAALVVTPRLYYGFCPNGVRVINRSDLEGRGSHMVYLGGKMRVVTVGKESGGRPWE
jgi:competence protein ComEC